MEIIRFYLQSDECLSLRLPFPFANHLKAFTAKSTKEPVWSSRMKAWRRRPHSVKTDLALGVSFRTVWSREQLKDIHMCFGNIFCLSEWKAPDVKRKYSWILQVSQRLLQFHLSGFRRESLHPQWQPWKWLSFFVTHPCFVSAVEIGLPWLEKGKKQLNGFLFTV